MSCDYVMLPGISAHRISSPPSAILAEYGCASSNAFQIIDAPLTAFGLQCYAIIYNVLLWNYVLDYIGGELCCYVCTYVEDNECVNRMVIRRVALS